MTPYYEDDAVTLYHGDCLDVLRTLPDNSVDSVCTDPPYGLEFMGKEWDAFGKTRDPRTAGRVGAGAVNDSGLKTDGGMTGVRVNYGGKRPMTWRCDTCNKRDQFRNHHAAAFPDCTGTWVQEVIDPSAPAPLAAFGAWCEQWAVECLRVLKPGGHLLAFGGTRTWHRLACAVEDAGFEVRDSIAWLHGQGFPKGKQQLKPAFEPVVVARKPLAGTVAANVLAHGTGALNIDGTRIGAPDGHGGGRKASSGFVDGYEADGFVASTQGRWPANVVLDDSQAAELDRQSGTLTSGSRNAGTYKGLGYMGSESADFPSIDGDSGGASRFFPTFRYEAKAPTVERPRDGDTAHPTVKPLDLMRWLVRLVTPPGGVILEPFAGSGTTCEAAVIEGFRCIAVEREEAYLPLIVARLSKPIQVDLFGGAA